MKTLVLSLLAVLAVNAEARTPITQLKGQLDRFRIAQAHEAKFGRASSGMVGIDLIKRQITIAIYPRTNTRCMPKPVVVVLPIQSIRQDSCKVARYTARTAEAIPGGVIETIEVLDNTKNNCPTLVALSPVEVNYTTSQAVFPPKSDTSKFEGSKGLQVGGFQLPPVSRCM